MEITNLYNMLLQALRLVASSSNVQISVMPNFVNIPEEIALIYNDAYLTLTQLQNQNLIPKEALEILKKIDELFEKMSKDPSLWTLDILENDKNWRLSRDLDKSVLKSLHERYDKPNLDFIHWV